MQGHSAAFEQAVSGSHIANCLVDVIQDQKVVATLVAHSGSVTADRTAAQMRSFDVEITDPTGTLTPEGMGALLAPFGTRLQLWRGVRLSSTDIIALRNNTQASWAVSDTSTGVLNGVVGSASGALTLVPAFLPSPAIYPSPGIFPRA